MVIVILLVSAASDLADVGMANRGAGACWECGGQTGCRDPGWTPPRPSHFGGAEC